MRTWHRFPLLALSLLLLPFESVFSQMNKLDQLNLEETMRNPWRPDRSVFLQDWLILGSIPIAGIEEIDKDFLVAEQGEANVRPEEGKTMTIAGGTMKWTRLTCKDVADLQRFFQGGRTEDAVAYAYTTIHRDKAGELFLTLGTDDAVKVWLNGVLVHRMVKLRGLTLDEDAIHVNLNAGDNRLLLKVQQAKGGWGFAVRMLENANLLNILTGNVECSIADVNTAAKKLTLRAESNLDQSLMQQVVTMDVYGAGGKVIVSKTMGCSKPLILDYASWPEGVYEFRLRYRDIRGTEFFKYVTWYNGDVLAAARDVVNSAPQANVRTPEAATHRMLADMILQRLGKNLTNPDSAKLVTVHPPLMEFAEMTEHTQIRPGGFVRLAYIDEVDNSPQFCRCYLPLNYDPSKRWPMVVYLHGHYDNNPSYINLWDVDRRHETPSDKQNVIFIEPHGRGNTAYLGIGDHDVLRCMAMARQAFSVDSDRVYLMGSSMGGFGTWNVATRHPEMFAAIAPIYGGGDYHVFTSKENLARMTPWDTYVADKSSSTAQLEALANMPILVSHGDQDQSVDVNLSRYIVRLLQRWNYNVRYIEVPGKGHTDLGLWDQIVSWLLEHKRNVAPRLVRVRSAELQHASAYWVKVSQRISPYEFMVVDAEVLQGNLLRVDSKNVCELVLNPDRALFDPRKPVVVVWNGTRLTFENHQEHGIVLKQADYVPAPHPKTADVSGPIADAQNTPFVIVVGTISPDSMMRKAIGQKAEQLKNGWVMFQNCVPRMMNDVDLTESDMNAYSLCLLGGPAENKVSKLIFPMTPFQISSDEITIDGQSFKTKDAVLHAVYPNPRNPQRYINIIAGTSGAGMCFFDPLRADLFEYDYYIADGKIPTYSKGATGQKIMVVTGFFDRNWRVTRSFFVEGDASARSLSAYYVVNNDMSTSVVSKASPSVELLKSYAGTYEMSGGPRVRIFLEDGILKGAQQGQTAVLTATADNEFYVKDANLSVSFRKDGESSEYAMVVYQSGQEFTFKKSRQE